MDRPPVKVEKVFNVDQAEYLEFRSFVKAAPEWEGHERAGCSDQKETEPGEERRRACSPLDPLRAS